MTTSLNLDFGSPDFKIAGLESKFDFIGVPNSFVRCFEAQLNRFEITVLYQLLRWHSWSNSGIVLRGIKWIYKSVASMIEDAFCGVKPGKLYRALNKLVQQGFLLKEQLHREHFGDVHACAAYNRRYYYSPVMELVMECIVDTLTKESPQTLSTLGFSTKENQVCQNETTDFSKQKNITHTTSTSIPSPTPPLTPPGGMVEGEPEKLNSFSEPQGDRHGVAQGNPNPTGQKASESQPVRFTDVVARPPRVEQKVNKGKPVQKLVQNETCLSDNIVTKSDSQSASNAVSKSAAEKKVSTDKPSSKDVAPPKRPNKPQKTPRGTKPSFNPGLAPWKSLEQFRSFYRALVASPYVRRQAKNLEALVHRIVNELKQGVPHPFWDDFTCGRPIGSSTRQEWQMSDGSPHPDFIEYLAEKLIRGNNTQTREIAISEALRIAKDPETARFFWKECKVSLVNAKAQTERDRALGVSNPVTPVWTHERIEPTIEEAAAASMEIKGINQQATAAIAGAIRHRIRDGESAELIEAASNPQAQLNSGDKSITGSAAQAEDMAVESTATADPWLEDSPKRKKSIRETIAEERGGIDKIPKIIRPKKVKSRQKRESYKLDIKNLDIAQINLALADPVLNAELTPQIFLSDYRIITDYLGRITGVEPPLEDE